LAARNTPSGGSKPDKLWRDAIHRAVKRTLEDGQTRRLDALADRLVEKGLEGDVVAMKEVGDRLDGKSDANLNLNASDSFIEALRTVNAIRQSAVGGVVGEVGEQSGPVRH
jgi:hypothetical protein